MPLIAAWIVGGRGLVGRAHIIRACGCAWRSPSARSSAQGAAGHPVGDDPMILQNWKPENFSRKPVKPGVSGAAVRVPVEGASSRGGEGVAEGVPGRRRSRRTSIGRMHTDELERLYGKSKGGNRDVEDELRRRGHNSKMLREAEWGHDQRGDRPKGPRDLTPAKEGRTAWWAG